jgi:hypothetical protein
MERLALLEALAARGPVAPWQRVIVDDFVGLGVALRGQLPRAAAGSREAAEKVASLANSRWRLLSALKLIEFESMPGQRRRRAPRYRFRDDIVEPPDETEAEDSDPSLSEALSVLDKLGPSFEDGERLLDEALGPIGRRRDEDPVDAR